MSDYAIEVEPGERFGFGANWARFLATLNDERVEEAKSSLRGTHAERRVVGR